MSLRIGPNSVLRQISRQHAELSELMGGASRGPAPAAVAYEATAQVPKPKVLTAKEQAPSVARCRCGLLISKSHTLQTCDLNKGVLGIAGNRPGA